MKSPKGSKFEITQLRGMGVMGKHLADGKDNAAGNSYPAIYYFQSSVRQRFDDRTCP